MPSSHDIVAGIAGWEIGAGQSFRHSIAKLAGPDLISSHLLSSRSCPTVASLLLCVRAMNVGYVTAIAALAGATLGGLTSFASSWTTLHAQLQAMMHEAVSIRCAISAMFAAMN
jgi:hypothetical protein